MNTFTHELKSPQNITWQSQPLPARCEHELELLAQLEDGSAFKRCLKCGSLEAV